MSNITKPKKQKSVKSKLKDVVETPANVSQTTPSLSTTTPSLSATTPNQSDDALSILVQSEETSQLEQFVKNLGYDKPVMVYYCNKQAFISTEVLIPILNVSLTWFKKNAECYTHYMEIDKVIYCNKYGLTKFIAQSKEPVAFILQDYIYEIVYKLEKHGTVSIDDVQNRQILHDQLSHVKLLLADTQDELAMRQNIINRHKSNEAELMAEYEQLRLDNALLIEENAKYKSTIELITTELSCIKEESEKYYTCAKKLSKYVKTRAPKAKLTELSDDSSAGDSDPEQTIEEAQLAKSFIYNKPSKVNGKPVNRTLTNVTNKKPRYYLMRSAKPITADYYQWFIVETLPPVPQELRAAYKTFKSLSVEYLLGNVTTDKITDVYYANIPSDNFPLVELYQTVFEIFKYMKDEHADKLLNL